MWFAFPKGVSAISVEQQAFVSMFTDTEGRDYFQAPDHFAPMIIANKDFKVTERPKGLPKSIKNIEPKNDGAIQNLATEIVGLKADCTELRTSLNELHGKYRAKVEELRVMSDDRDGYKDENEKLRDRLSHFEEETDTDKDLAEAAIPKGLELDAKKSDKDEDEDEE